MGSMDFHGVKSCFLCSSGAVPELLCQLMDFLHGQFSRNFRHRRIFQSRRRHRLFSCNGAAGFPSRMINLRRDFPAGLMDSPCQFFMALNLAVIPQSRKPHKSSCRRSHCVILCDNQSPASPGLVFMVRNIFFCCGTIRIAVIGHHGRHDHSIFQFQISDLHWLKKFHFLTPSFSFFYYSEFPLFLLPHMMEKAGKMHFLSGFFSFYLSSILFFI